VGTEQGAGTEIGWSTELLFRRPRSAHAPLTLRSRSAHMLCMAGADVGQLSQIWSDAVHCSSMWSSAVIGHTGRNICCSI